MTKAKNTVRARSARLNQSLNAKARDLRSAASALEHGRHATARKKIRSALDIAHDQYVTDKALPDYTRPTAHMLRNSDAELAILDRALDAAENVLRELLARYAPKHIREAFAQHVETHLGSELANIKAHGHKNDDPNENPTRLAHRA